MKFNQSGAQRGLRTAHGSAPTGALAPMGETLYESGFQPVGTEQRSYGSAA